MLRFFTASVVANIGWWISTVILLHIKADGFTVPKAAAIFITIAIVLLLVFFGLYFAYCLESLCFTIQKERNEEEPAEVTSFLSSVNSKAEMFNFRWSPCPLSAKVPGCPNFCQENTVFLPAVIKA